jgi:hypothetical protein
MTLGTRAAQASLDFFDFLNRVAERSGKASAAASTNSCVGVEAEDENLGSKMDAPTIKGPDRVRLALSIPSLRHIPVIGISERQLIAGH